MSINNFINVNIKQNSQNFQLLDDNIPLTPEPTVSLSQTATPPITPTISKSPTNTPSNTVTPSISPSLSQTPTPTYSRTPTQTATPYPTPTKTMTYTPTISETKDYFYLKNRQRINIAKKIRVDIDCESYEEKLRQEG